MGDLEEAAAELYAVAPEDFVAARTRLVKQARQARDKALADQLGALRKPTRTAWLVNALARDEAAAVGALIDLGDALREAQGQRDGAALRELSARRRKEIDALVRRATELGREAGHPPTEATVNELAQTLQAALGDPAVAAQVRGARLAGAAVYGGFGGPAEAAGEASGAGGDLAAMLAASMPAAPEAKGRDEVEERRARVAEERRAALRAARDEARTALDEAQEAAGRATEEADQRAAEVERLTQELAAARDVEREAGTTARRARDEVRKRRTAADEAEQAYDAAAG